MVPNEQAYRRFQRRVDRLCFLIVATDCSQKDIDIERLYLRTEAARLFPEKFHLYEMIYESRFRRLLTQFRPPAVRPSSERLVTPTQSRG